jgi:hypothetical protein
VTLVREEFGPTLPQLLGPRLAVLPRPVRVALAVAAVAVVLVLAWVLFLRGTPGQSQAIVHGSQTFNLVYSDALHRVAARPGEELRLQQRAGPRQSLAVRPLRLPPYRGDVTAALMGLSARMIDQMRASYDGFVWRGEGRVAINKQPGYQILFQAMIGGRLTYGKRVLLAATADPPPREGLDILLLAARSPVVPSLDALGANGPLKNPYRSLRFGEDRP